MFRRMTKRITLHRARAILLASAGLAVVCAGHAVAEGDAAGWVPAQRSAARLIAGERSGAHYQGGIEIKLDPGFKTYWRNPGDSGVPPSFDWSRSQNVAAVDVRYPTPARFFDGVGYAIGYMGDVTYPIAVTPRDPSKPVVLDLTVDYAVCEKLCIPTQVSLSHALPAQAPRAAQPLATAAARVPHKVALGAAHEGLAVASVTASASGDKVDLIAHAALPAGSTVADLFVEGPDGWYFGKPEIAQDAPGQAVIRVPVEERPRQIAADRIPLVLTLAGQAHAIEVTTDLDVSGLAR